jgi:hypothetical protein
MLGDADGGQAILADLQPFMVFGVEFIGHGWAFQRT